MKVVILENIRSGYNVGNVIRTADALGWDVWLSGYTATPDESIKVLKTSLGAEKSVWIKRFYNPVDAIQEARKSNLVVIAAEVTKNAVSLSDFAKKYSGDNIAVIFGNEVHGVLQETLEKVDNIVYIPMDGIKESLNVGQTTAIFMRELS